MNDDRSEAVPVNLEKAPRSGPGGVSPEGLGAFPASQPGWQTPPSGWQPPPPGWGPPPVRSRRVSPWIVPGVALAVVVALAIGVGTWFAVHKSGEDPAGRPLAGQLSTEFPTAPTQAWRIDATVTRGSSIPSAFLSPDSSRNQYLSPGAISDGRYLVTLVDPGTQGASANRGKSVVVVDGRSGVAEWYPLSVRGCADRMVDGAIACLTADSAIVVRVGDGKVVARYPVDPTTFQIAFNGSTVFVVRYDNSARQVTAFSGGRMTWSRAYDTTEARPNGDSSAVTATSKLFAVANGNVLVVNSADGHQLVNSAGSASVRALKDGSVAVSTSTSDGSNQMVKVVHPEGDSIDIAGSSFAVPSVATRDRQAAILAGTSVVSTDDGRSEAALPLGGSASTLGLPLITGTRAVVATSNEDGTSLSSYDTTNGTEIWRTKADMAYPFSTVTDGRQLMYLSSGSLVAQDLATGVNTWRTGVDGENDYGGEVFAVDGTVVVVTNRSVIGFRGTGGPAHPPGYQANSDDSDGNGSSGDRYVTKCGRTPTFTPQSFRTATGGLVVTMKITATCPGGDILSNSSTNVTIRDDAGLIASGNFDFSGSPVVIPKSSGGSENSSTTMEFTYPLGSFYRLPDTTSGGSSAQGSSGGSADRSAGGRTFIVECTEDGQNSTTDSSRVPSSASAAPGAAGAGSSATGPGRVSAPDVDRGSSDALRVQANSDRGFIIGNLNNRWVAQLSSKRPGLVTDGRTWNNQAILDEFLALRLRFSDVRLLYSDEWTVFTIKGWWVTVAAATFPGPVEANNWCAQQQFDRDHCFAKLISTTAPPEGSTAYR